MGIILIPLGILVIGAYLWVVVTTARWAYRKYSAKGAIVTFAILALLPTWDALSNHYYFTQVLCKRPEVGLHIYEKVVLPMNMYDESGNPKLPDSMNDAKHPFLGRYFFEIKYTDEGSYPITANRHFIHGTYDVSTNKFLSKIEDYQPTGGWWWANVFRPVLSAADYDWIMSRGAKQSCFDRSQMLKMLLEAKVKPFIVK